MTLRRLSYFRVSCPCRKWRWLDSNQRPPVLQTGAATELSYISKIDLPRQTKTASRVKREAEGVCLSGSDACYRKRVLPFGSLGPASIKRTRASIRTPRPNPGVTQPSSIRRAPPASFIWSSIKLLFIAVIAV